MILWGEGWEPFCQTPVLGLGLGVDFVFPLSQEPVSFDHATFVHATSLRATFVHPTFVQGQNLVVYNCNHSSLDQTIKFQTSYRAKPKLGKLQLILSLAQLSPSLFIFIFLNLKIRTYTKNATRHSDLRKSKIKNL